MAPGSALISSRLQSADGQPGGCDNGAGLNAVVNGFARAAVKTGVIFKDAKNKAMAKNFVAFMLDEANLTPYVEGSLGRWFPVTKNAQQSAFWKSDPHRLAVYNQFMNGTTPFEFTKNYKFTVLNNENVWAKAMNRILSEKVPVDKATDEMIARIKAVAN